MKERHTMAKNKITVDGQNRREAILNALREREVSKLHKRDAMKIDYRTREYFKPRLDTTDKDK